MNEKTEPTTVERAVEQCIGIMGTKAYQGSYAAPREAFRKIIWALLNEIAEEVEKKSAGSMNFGGDYDRQRHYNAGLDEALILIRKRINNNE